MADAKPLSRQEGLIQCVERMGAGRGRLWSTVTFSTAMGGKRHVGNMQGAL